MTKAICQRTNAFVIPAQAGISARPAVTFLPEIPASAGMTVLP
jgi:hypothetical protein